MTKTAKKADEAKTYFASVSEAFETAKSKMEVPAAARDFVAKGAASAKDRAESVHGNVVKFTDGAEKIATSLVGGYANFVRGALDATLANVQHAMTTVEKVAAAKSLNEAVQIQVDAVRESANANMERVRGVAETAKTAVSEGAKEVQAQFSKLYASEKKAA